MSKKKSLLAELRAAQGRKIEFDGERKVVFNFNTLAILQEFYPNPYEALAGLETMDLGAIRAITYSALHSANAKCELSLEDVGLLLGHYSEEEPDENGRNNYSKIIAAITAELVGFFPSLQPDGEVETEVKND